jgi:hypothetical protein
LNKLTNVLMCTGFILAASTAFAADDIKKPDPMMKKGTMTMQECKDHMSMAKKDGMKKDDSMTKEDMMCADMMKSGSAMQPDDMASGAMKK